MSYAETLYGTMLQAQMRAANQKWAQQEHEKEMSQQRQEQGFDQFSKVIELMQRAQEQEHKRKMDIAQLVGQAGAPLPEGIAGQKNYEQMASAASAASEANAAAKALADMRAREKYFGGIQLQEALSGARQEKEAQSKARTEREQKKWEMEQAFKAGKIPSWMKYKPGTGRQAPPEDRAQPFKPMRIAEKMASQIMAEGRQYAQQEDEIPSQYNDAARVALEIGAKYDELYRNGMPSKEANDKLIEEIKSAYKNSIGGGRSYGGSAPQWSAGKQRALNMLNQQRASQGLPPLPREESGL